MLSRRAFLRTAGLAGTGLMLDSKGAAAWKPVGPGQAAPIIDGLGEVRIEYDRELVAAIRDSGMRACVVTVGNPGLHDASTFDDMAAEVYAYDAHIARHPDLLTRAVDTTGITRAVRDNTIGLLYYTQNATPLQSDVEALVRLRALGVRIVQLTYNTRNLLGDGCLERTNAGLSNFGIDVVSRMNELGMLVDVSHCGEATTLDGITHSSRPVAITHAGCRVVYDHPRNKTDAALRALAERGGVIGIYQINPYLGPNERNTLEHYLAHLDHAINVAGVEHVGIGSDREYRTIPDTPAEKQKLVDELSRLRPGTTATVRWPFFLTELNHPRRMRTIADALARRGRSSSDIEKIMGGNFLRLFRETIG